jgi:hypothetical protein
MIVTPKIQSRLGSQIKQVTASDIRRLHIEMRYIGHGWLKAVVGLLPGKQGCNAMQVACNNDVEYYPHAITLSTITEYIVLMLYRVQSKVARPLRPATKRLLERRAPD